PFDLERAPLLRVVLVRESDDNCVLALVVHHLVADGWSLGVIARDLAALYAGQTLALLKTRYADVVAWQRRLRPAGEMDELTGYWRDALAGAPETLTLPAPAADSVTGGEAGLVTLSLAPDVVPSVETWARAHDATLFMALVAAFHLALARVSGQDDIVIGTPLARRDRPEWEDCVGFFASALPLRVRAAGDLPLDEALTRVRAAVGGAFGTQDRALEQIVDAVGVRRSPDRHPIFQACLVLQNMPVSELTLAGLRATRVPDPYPVTPFDLWLSFDVTEAPATARLLYR